MATKTIYVKDEDLPIFERARELSDDSLSGMIVEALRRYIKAEEARAEGFQEIIIPVSYTKDESHGWRKIRFTGKLLAEAREDSPFRDYKVYLTQRGKLILYMVFGPIVQREAEENGESEEDENRLYRIYDSFDELRNAKIPDELLEDVAQKLEQDYIETLDV